MTAPLDEVDEIVALRKQEADEFYNAIHPAARDARRTPRAASGARGDVVDEAGVLFDVHSGSTATIRIIRRPDSRRQIRTRRGATLN